MTSLKHTSRGGSASLRRFVFVHCLLRISLHSLLWHTS